MATKTRALQLTKPDYKEKADIMVINQNMDIIDSAIDANTTGKVDKPHGLASNKFLKTGPNDTLIWGDALNNDDVVHVVEDWMEENMPAAQSFVLDKNLTSEVAAAQAKAAGDRIRSLERDITEVVTATAQSVYVTSEGWRLNESDGLCSTNSGYKLVKFEVTPGDVLKITADDRFQFQSIANVPSSGDNNRIGNTYEAGAYNMTVPTGANYLILSTPISNSAVSVSLLGGIKDAVAELQDDVAGAVRFDEPQTLTATQKAQALENIG